MTRGELRKCPGSNREEDPSGWQGSGQAGCKTLCPGAKGMEEQVGGGSNGRAKSPQREKACMGHSKTNFTWILRFVRLGPAQDD